MKAVLIGLGMVADTHLAAINSAEGVSLGAIVGRTAEKLDAFSKKAQDVLGYDVPTYTDLKSALSDTDVDFAILVTPPDARAAFIDTLSQAGIPVLMEKPIERSFESAQNLVETCASKSVALGIVLQHRARAASIALKAELDKQNLGDIATIEVRVPWWRDQSYYDAPGRGTYARDGGGVMITQAIHTLDLLLWLLGPMDHVQALMHRTPLHALEAEDWAGAIFKMHDGAVGTLMATTANFPGQSETIVIQGTKATARLENGVLTLHYLDGRVETFGETAQTGSGADPMAFTHTWHQSIIENFVAAIVTGEPLIASGKSALMAHAVIDAMEQSSRSKQSVEVPIV